MIASRVIPSKEGNHNFLKEWIPVFTGMTHTATSL